jgi:Toprim domain
MPRATPAQDQHRSAPRLSSRRHDYRALLSSVGVDVEAFGSRMALCPMCSHLRKKKNQKCLSVRVDGDGFQFKCHHCDWKGGSTRYTPAGRREPTTPRRDDQPSTTEAAARIWREGVDPRGTIVDRRYLPSRKLTLPAEIAGEVLRFHAALYFDGRTVPGMVALLRDIETDIACGIIRILLDEHGHKITPRMLGRAQGAAVKLDADAHVTEGLHICEGVETGIAAMVAGYRPVWALGSVGAIRKFPVLAGIDALTILGEPGDANAEAVEEVSARWHDAGRDVLIVEMLIGDDLNDAWREATP